MRDALAVRPGNLLDRHRLLQRARGQVRQHRLGELLRDVDPGGALGDAVARQDLGRGVHRPGCTGRRGLTRAGMSAAATGATTSPAPTARWTNVRRFMWRYSRRMTGSGGGRGAAGALLVASVAAAQPGGFPLVSGNPLTAFRVSTSRATSSVVDVEGPGFTRAIRVDVRARPDLGRRARRPPVARGGPRRGRLRHLPGARDSGRRTPARPTSPSTRSGRRRTTTSRSTNRLRSAPTGRRSRCPSPGARPTPPTRRASSSASAATRRRSNRRHRRRRLRRRRDPRDAAAGAVHLRRARRRRSLARRGRGPHRGDPQGRADRRGRRRRPGEAVEDAEVRIEQRRHAFPFGSALVASRLTAGPPLDGQPDENAAYRFVVERCSTPAASRTTPSGRPGKATGGRASTSRRPWPRSTGCAAAACASAATSWCGPAGTTCRRAWCACAGRPTRPRDPTAGARPHRRPDAAHPPTTCPSGT